jgi:hypothetical protein
MQVVARQGRKKERGCTAIRDEDCYHESIDTDDTSHNDRNDVFDD